jgi:CBS domain-containing protein
MLLAAIVGGHVAHWIHFPRVIGFVVGGAVLRAVLYAVVGPDHVGGAAQALDDAAEPLNAIKDLALGLILFLIGGVFERSRLRSASTHVFKISAAEVGLSLAMVFIGCLAAAVITLRDNSIGDSAVLALLLATAAIATAPAATLFVLQEYESKGPITDTILGLTGANNIVCIVLFYLTFFVLASFGAITTSGVATQQLWLALASTTIGSLAVGVVCGTLLGIFHAKLPIAETLLVFFALFILLGGCENWLLEQVGVSYNFLLTCLVIGAIFANVAMDPQKLESTVRTVGFPIFAGFFVLAGYGLHVEDLASMGWIGGVYVFCRFFGKVLGCKFGVGWAGGPERAGELLGTALLCQAAVVIGLATFVERNWASELGKTFSTVVLGSVVVFELVGPLLVKRCVVQAGEVKAITLLSRTASAADGSSTGRITLQALLRLFGWGARPAPDTPAVMSVEHIMRTNVQLIPVSATFDEVLHFIERSIHSHFPVVHESGELAGMIHFSDVRDVIYDPAWAELVTAADLADPKSEVVAMDMPLTDLLDVFTRQNVAVLPVVEQPESKRIVGIVEQRDLLRAVRAS